MNEIKKFFKEVAAQKKLQEQLYKTKNIIDVALLAKEQGFIISGAEILKAQACRLIEMATARPDEAQLATAGQKPNLGAQWGREGSGFLERAGFWLIKLYRLEARISCLNPHLTNLLARIEIEDELETKINACCTLDEVAEVAQKAGFDISAIELLVYQALCILQLDEETANMVAKGAAQIREVN